MAQALRVTAQAEQKLRVNMAFEKEVMSRSTLRNKPLFEETVAERRATMEVEDANPPWDAREREIIKNVDSYLEQSERIWVGIEELEDSLLGPVDQICTSVSRRMRGMKEDTASSWSTKSFGAMK